MVSPEQRVSPQVLVGSAVDGTVVAVLSGSLDLADAAMVKSSLRAPAHGQWPRVLALDLASVDFCDCATLGALMGVRNEARQAGCRVVISMASPAVQLLLQLTATATSFDYPPALPDALPLERRSGGSGAGHEAEPETGESSG